MVCDLWSGFDAWPVYEQVALHSVDRLLDSVLPVFRELHLNTTAVVWVWDADKPHFLASTGGSVTRCGVWEVSTMSSKYTSGEVREPVQAHIRTLVVEPSVHRL